MPRVQAGTVHISYDIFGSGDPLLLMMGFATPGAAYRQLAARLRRAGASRLGEVAA